MKLLQSDIKKIFKEANLKEIAIAISKLQGAMHMAINEDSLIFKEKIYLADIQSHEFSKFAHFNIYLNDSEQLLVRKHFPLLFLPTDFKVTLDQAPDLIKKIEILNELSPRKREIVFTKDILKAQVTGSPVVLYASSHEPLTLSNLSKLQKEWSDKNNSDIDFSYAENGVLVYSQKVEKDYETLQEIETALKKLKVPYQIIPHREELIKEFNKTAPRLVVIAYTQESIKSKDLYVRLKTQDSLVKIVEVDELKLNSSTPLHKRIEQLYYADYFESASGIELQKSELDFEKEETLKKEIFKVISHYNPVKHVRIAYIIYKLSAHYNVSRMTFFLKKLDDKKESLRS